MLYGRGFEGRFILLTAVVTAAVVAADPAWAGPGGQFVKAAARNPIVQILLCVVAAILLPLVAYATYRMRKAVRETKRDLKRLSERYPRFAWAVIERQVREAIRNVYAGWSKGDLSPAATYLTRDYFESQQELLDRWAEEGKRNHLSLEKVRSIRPLRVIVENEEYMSQVSVLLCLDVVDYLEHTPTGEVLKGKMGVETHVETIWNLVDEEGRWLLASIEDGSQEWAIADEPNLVDTSFLDRRARSKPTLAKAAQDEPLAQVEGAPVRIAQNQDGH